MRLEWRLVGGTSGLISARPGTLLVAGTVDGVVADSAIAVDVVVDVVDSMSAVGSAIAVDGVEDGVEDVADSMGAVGSATEVGDEGEDVVGVTVEEGVGEGAVTRGLEERRLSRAER